METALLENDAAPRAFSSGGATSTVTEDFDEDNGPPSSINVARALASLRADELRRVEELVRADEAEEAKRAVAAAAPPPASHAPEPAPPPPPPTVLIGKSIALPKLAEQMGMQAKDLTAQLVASGFYSVHAKTVFPRETARTVAQMFGWHVADAPDEPEPPPPPKKKAKTSAKKKAAAKKRR